MNQSFKLKTTAVAVRNWIGPTTIGRVFLLLALTLVWFVLSPMAQAQLSPPPDGGYPGDNTAEGDNALFSLTTGFGDTAIGFNALFSLTTGRGNTAIGSNALITITTGQSNTACGSQALRDNTSDFNTAIGGAALSDNTTGFENTAAGSDALTANTEGYRNTASGDRALEQNTTGFENTASGFFALDANTTGFFNTASGVFALSSNTVGTRNTATGNQALVSNITGSRNTATGYETLFYNTTGNHNSAHGWIALFSNTTGNFNIALGDGAGDNLTTGDNNIDIGNEGVAGESNTIRIGTQGTQTATYVAGISGAGVMGVAVKVNAAGQLGTAPSAARFKDEIRAMDKASEAILALKPVTFRYKKEIDPDRTPQFGLVAEDVEKVNPALVAHDAEGKVYTVRYEAVNAMLLNEFLKEHHQVHELRAIVAKQQKQIEALTAGLQKVSAQLELNKPAPQTVLNNQ